MMFWKHDAAWVKKPEDAMMDFDDLNPVDRIDLRLAL